MIAKLKLKQPTKNREAETETEVAESTDESKGDIIFVANAGGEADVDAEDVSAGVGRQVVSSQIVRSTSSQQLVGVFLDDVPDTSETRSEGVRKQKRVREVTQQSFGDSEFLFTPVSVAQPFLATLDLDLNEQSFVQDESADAFEEIVLEKVVVGSTAAVSTTVSVGYVVWMLRGGSLLTTFLSSLPAWQAFDPLPVLESFEGESEGDGESLESLVGG